MKLTKDSAQVTGKTFKEWEKSGLHTLADAWNAGLHAALASKEAAIATKNAELQSVREAYMEIERKLQIKLASAEARIEAAVKLAEAWERKAATPCGETSHNYSCPCVTRTFCADELLRALGRKVEP
jgi:hypothetical protein